jgi:hypothetical protein
MNLEAGFSPAFDRLFEEVAGLSDPALAEQLAGAYADLRGLVLDAADSWTDVQDQAELRMVVMLGELRRRMNRSAA